MKEEKFKQWVKSYGGPERLAADLGLTSWAVRNWLQRKSYPQIETMKRIVKLSKGKLEIADVITGTDPELKQQRGA